MKLLSLAAIATMSFAPISRAESQYPPNWCPDFYISIEVNELTLTVCRISDSKLLLNGTSVVVETFTRPTEAHPTPVKYADLACGMIKSVNPVDGGYHYLTVNLTTPLLGVWGTLERRAMFVVTASDRKCQPFPKTADLPPDYPFNVTSSATASRPASSASLFLVGAIASTVTTNLMPLILVFFANLLPFAHAQQYTIRNSNSDSSNSG